MPTTIVSRLFSRKGRTEVPAPALRVAEDERIYAIGDIHGRADLLRKMLAAIVADADARADGRRVRLIFLGDYIDRGDQSRRTLALLRGVAEAAEDGGALFLRGNHEAALLDFLDDPVAGAAWLDFGGRQTLADYGAPPPALRPDAAALSAAHAALTAAIGPDLDFLRATRVSARSGDVVFVHAGFEPSRPIDDQPPAVALWGARASAPPAPDLLVVHGHFADAEPVDAPLRICVDTGAYYSGRLTAVRLDAGRGFISVG